MKRFRRSVVIAIAAASLSLCVATAAMWVRSYWGRDELNINLLGTTCWISSGAGGISVIVEIQSREHDGFHYESYFGYLRVVVVFALSAFLFSIQVIHQRATHSSGLCIRCGYDLRATPDRCPECGTVPAKVEAVK